MTACTRRHIPDAILRSLYRTFALRIAVLQHTDWLQALYKPLHLPAIHKTPKLTEVPPSDAHLIKFHVLGSSLRTCEFATLRNISQHGGF